MTRARELAAHLSGAPSLAIVCHDDPDPDCIASALALRAIAEAEGVASVTIFYGGEITHQQNRAFVNLLDVDLVHLAERSLAEFALVAFVDHSLPGGHTSVPPTVGVDIVVDHHRVSEPASAAFVDRREAYGATASIFVEYLRELEFELTPMLASALLFAVHRERLDYVRRPTIREYESALYVFPASDVDLLEKLYGAAFSPGTLDAIGDAIHNREIRGSTLVTGVGRTLESDALPQAADYLLNLEGIDTVLVFGVVGGAIRLSARSIDSRVNVGAVLEAAFGDVGAVGGHADVAGGTIPLGIFADSAGDDGALVAFVSRRVTARFFESMHLGEDEPV